MRTGGGGRLLRGNLCRRQKRDCDDQTKTSGGAMHISFPGNYLSDYFPLGHACLCVLQAPFHVVSGFGSNETRDKPRAGSVARLLAFTRSGAVGFIDWLDGFIDMQAHVLNAFATAVSNDNIR